MNCSEFSEVVSDLARNEGLGRAERERALAHADACPRCDEELATARALSSALGVLASSVAGVGAPARVEEFLRREMRQRGAGRVVPMRRATRWAIGGVVGLAAAALLSIGIMKPSIWHHGSAGATGVISATDDGAGSGHAKLVDGSAASDRGRRRRSEWRFF